MYLHYMVREAAFPLPVDQRPLVRLSILKVDHGISNHGISEKFIVTAITPYFCFGCTEQAAAPQL